MITPYNSFDEKDSMGIDIRH